MNTNWSAIYENYCWKYPLFWHLEIQRNISIYRYYTQIINQGTQLDNARPIGRELLCP